MNAHRFVSSIRIKLLFPYEEDVIIEMNNGIFIKNKIRKICQEFGFNMNGYDSNCDFYKCKGKDLSFSSLEQRTKFVIKRLLDEKEIVILGLKLKAILADSDVDKNLFNLNK